MGVTDYLWLTYFIMKELKRQKSFSPTPGIEPGPPGWKPGILAIRPRGMSLYVNEIIWKIK